MLLRLADNSEIGTLHGHFGDVNDVDWSPAGNRLATPSSDGTVRIWDATSRQALLSLSDHKGAVCCVKWNRNGRWLASGGVDGTVCIFEGSSADNVLQNTATSAKTVAP